MVSVVLLFAITFAVFERCGSMGLFGGGGVPSMGQHGLGTASNGSGGLANASYGAVFGQQSSGLPALLLSLLGAGGGANGTNGTNRGPHLPPVQIYAAGCGEFGIYLPGSAATGTKYGSGENKTFSLPSRFGPSAGHEGIAPIMSPNATFTIYKSGCGQFLLPNTRSLELLKNGSLKSGNAPIDKAGKKGKPGNKHGMGDGQQAPDFITQLLALLGGMQGTGGMGPPGGSGENGSRNANSGMGTGPPAFLLPLLRLLGGAPNIGMWAVSARARHCKRTNARKESGYCFEGECVSYTKNDNPSENYDIFDDYNDTSNDNNNNFNDNNDNSTDNNDNYSSPIYESSLAKWVISPADVTEPSVFFSNYCRGRF
ncbi:hypothetical protein Aduo_015385 [Ancylostoma duodenale]